MLAMVMDLARRMAQANPRLEDPLQSEAIVLIDEVDLHLHASWQQTILPDLLRVFPNAQFIVTTHSPQVLTTVEPEQIQILDWQNNQPSLHT
jgi:predicted ATP-binding protein involved in virulence